MGCPTPFGVKDKNNPDVTQPVPCGKCPECIARRTSAWSFRLMQEDKISESSYFLTLTYDTDHVPITKNGFMQLCKRDIQLFFKRLRKAHYSSNKSAGLHGVNLIKYYAVGEYGGTYKRPHYHIIIYNAKLELIVGQKEADMIRNGLIILDGKQPYKCPSWELGHVTLGEVSGASVGYTLKYISKPWRPMHANDDRQPQFSLQSKGLGKNYLTPQMKNWHVADLNERMYCVLQDGRKISMPRYYKDKIYDEFQRQMVGKYQKEKILSELYEEQQKQGYDQWYTDKVNRTIGAQNQFNYRMKQTDLKDSKLF